MGQFVPIPGGHNGRSKATEQNPARNGWQVYDQYRVNQPHDRTCQRTSRS